MKTWFGAALGLALRGERFIAVLCFVAMSVALIADVVGREILESGIFGANRFAVFAMILCAMASFGIATATASHLRPRIADGLIPARWERPVVRLGHLTAAGILLMMAWFALDFVVFSRSIEERDLSLEWVLWPFQSALLLAFLLSALRYVIYAIWPDLAPHESVIHP